MSESAFKQYCYQVKDGTGTFVAVIADTMEEQGNWLVFSLNGQRVAFFKEWSHWTRQEYIGP